MWKILPLHLQIILIVLSTVSTLSVNKTDRIVGGKTVSIEDYPYNAAINNLEPKIFHKLCGGSILNEKYVLTYSNCINPRPDIITVRVGSSLRNDDGVVHSIINVSAHSHIAILEVFPLISFNERVQPIKLPEAFYDVSSDHNAVVTGWGLTAPDGEFSDQLQMATLTTISTQDCNKKWNGNFGDDKFCGYDNMKQKTVCKGDAGAPLVISGVQIGMSTGFYDSCKEGSYWSIPTFIKLSKFRDYIDNILHGH